jgi:hypothetical protein
VLFGEFLRRDRTAPQQCKLLGSGEKCDRHARDAGQL